jgi:hypothetical protein
MDMTPTPVSSQFPRKIVLPGNPVGVSCIWTVRERGVVVARTKNVFTNFGLSALASALSGGYIAPIYLVLDSAGTTLEQPVNIGQSQVVTNERVDLSGDMQLVLSPNLANQETVTFTGIPTGSGPYTYTLTSPATQTHNTGDTVLRQTLATDTMSTVLSEVQYDPTDAPNQRVQSYAGYAQGVGNWVVQFYITGTQAVDKFNYVGLADSLTIGQGNLHDHAVLGYSHTSGDDVEIDVSITLSNS